MYKENQWIGTVVGIHWQPRVAVTALVRSDLIGDFLSLALGQGVSDIDFHGRLALLTADDSRVEHLDIEASQGHCLHTHGPWATLGGVG